MEIVGPEPVDVERTLDLAAVKGRFAFDVPDVEWVRRKVSAAGLDATVRELPRVPHHERVTRMLDDFPDGAEVPFHGPWAVAVRGLPSDRRLPVRGVRMDADGPDAGRWHSVWVEVSGAEPARSVEIGRVLVDEARLMFADPTALLAWRVGTAADGLADLAFWGRDAERVAEGFAAPSLDADDRSFGWRDLPVEEAVVRARALRDHGGEDVRFAVDVRPHDDAYRLLEQARASRTGSGTVESDGTAVTGFFTSWGDGAFPVYRDLDAAGGLCRVRVELGAPDIVVRTRRFEELWSGSLSEAALVSADVAEHGIGWLHREPPDREGDSGWRVYSGRASQEYLDDPDHVLVQPLRDLVRADPLVEEVLRHATPATFERDASGGFRACPPPGVP